MAVDVAWDRVDQPYPGCDRYIWESIGHDLSAAIFTTAYIPVTPMRHCAVFCYQTTGTFTRGTANVTTLMTFPAANGGYDHYVSQYPNLEGSAGGAFGYQAMRNNSVSMFNPMPDFSIRIPGDSIALNFSKATVGTLDQIDILVWDAAMLRIP